LFAQSLLGVPASSTASALIFCWPYLYGEKVVSVQFSRVRSNKSRFTWKMGGLSHFAQQAAEIKEETSSQSRSLPPTAKI